MKTLHYLVAALALAVACAALAAGPPRTFAIPAAELVAARERLAGSADSFSAALKQLRSEADKLLKAQAASVMDKTQVAASGDKHDYFSFAPYWWPDPTKPDGLPYLRDDGKRNPESQRGTDAAAFSRTCLAVETLGLAFWFTRDERYAQQAARLTRAWFLDAATRMNPNLAHAQAIPGINSGRGIGIIEARHLINLQDGLALIAASSAWTAADGAAFSTWLGDYYRWLTTSKNGLDEAAAENNHGSWYDAQVVALALGLERSADARQVLAALPSKRIQRQIEPDGRQPLELERTKSLDYSLFNLEALMLLARFGENVGVEVWKSSTPEGRSLRAALVYVAPYADPAKPWPKQDLESAERSRILALLANALHYGEDAQFRAPLAKFAGPMTLAARWRLFASGQP
jgi:Tfp pilus assembly protein FimT